MSIILKIDEARKPELPTQETQVAKPGGRRNAIKSPTISYPGNHTRLTIMSIFTGDRIIAQQKLLRFHLPSTRKRKFPQTRKRHPLISHITENDIFTSPHHSSKGIHSENPPKK